MERRGNLRCWNCRWGPSPPAAAVWVGRPTARSSSSATASPARWSGRRSRPLPPPTCEPTPSRSSPRPPTAWRPPPRTPAPAAVAAVTSSTWRSGPSAASRPFGSPSSWNGWRDSSSCRGGTGARGRRRPGLPHPGARRGRRPGRRGVPSPPLPPMEYVDASARSPARPSPPPAPWRSCGPAPRNWKW